MGYRTSVEVRRGIQGVSSSVIWERERGGGLGAKGCSMSDSRATFGASLSAQ